MDAGMMTLENIVAPDTPSAALAMFSLKWTRRCRGYSH